ncbi:MAG TPA: NUDIX domain-containing protein [Herpetosiphonaceae bacterium]
MRPLLEPLLTRAIPLFFVGRAVYRRIRRPISMGVRALVVQDHQVLLVRAHGCARWDLPGGGVKRGESLREAAIRETREESGCVVEAERLLGMYLNLCDGMTNYVAVYVCRPINRPALALNIEIAEARYWPLDALPPVTPSVPGRLAEYAAGAYGLDGVW